MPGLHKSAVRHNRCRVIDMVARGGASGHLPHGFGQTEREEPPDAVAVANWVGDEEAELAEEVPVVAMSSTAADERLPVVVEGLDASSGRVVRNPSANDVVRGPCA